MNLPGNRGAETGIPVRFPAGFPNWIEGNGFQLLGVSFHEQTGFVVRWDVR